MKAVRFAEYGGPDVLRYEDAPRPQAGPGEVLIEVAGTSFNPVDAGIRAGYLQQVFPVRFPHTPGVDVAGTVAELGEGVSGSAVGDPVVGFLPMDVDGSAAQFVTAPAAVLTPAPTSIPLADAATLPAVALTAWQALFGDAGLRAGQRVLVNGAGGGVGGFAVQFAHQAGAIVVATASARSTDAVRAAGADQIVDYTSADLTTAVDPVDVVLNLVSASEPEITVLRSFVVPGGILVSTASPASPDSARSVRAANVQVRSDATQLAAIVAKVDASEVRVDVSSTHPLAELSRVHEQSAAGAIRGKVVLVPEPAR